MYMCKMSLAHSKNELMQWRGVRRLSVRLSVCKLLRKSLLLADKWPDQNKTCTRWSPGKRASRVCSRSRSRSKVTWYAHFFCILGMSYSVIDGLVGSLRLIAKRYRTRKLHYRKGDRAMRPIYGCPENFRDSLTTPTATFPKILWLLFRLHRPKKRWCVPGPHTYYSSISSRLPEILDCSFKWGFWTPDFGGRGRGWYRSKERWWVSIGYPSNFSSIFTRFRDIAAFVLQHATFSLPHLLSPQNFPPGSRWIAFRLQRAKVVG